MIPLDIPVAVQDLAAVAVCAIAVFMLWRSVRRSVPSGCPSCTRNPDTLPTGRLSSFDR